MKGKRFTDEQITYALRQAEGGTPVADVRRQYRSTGPKPLPRVLWLSVMTFASI